MPFGRYTVLTLIGSAVWCFALAGVGWALGSSYETFHHDFRFADYAIVGRDCGGLVVYFANPRENGLLD